MSVSRILKSGNVYCITCAERVRKSETGAIVIAFGGNEQDTLVYRGNVCTRRIPPAKEKAVTQCLAHGDISELHHLLRQSCGFPFGMDAYCSQCREVYCAKHDRLCTVMADDHPYWYDYSTATCPKGHTRIIHD